MVLFIELLAFNTCRLQTHY